jgi:hypothetical protein
MPLHLSWPSIMHWRGEDCNNSWFWVEDTFLKNLPEIKVWRVQSELSTYYSSCINQLFGYQLSEKASLNSYWSVR